MLYHPMNTFWSLFSRCQRRHSGIYQASTAYASSHVRHIVWDVNWNVCWGNNVNTVCRSDHRMIKLEHSKVHWYTVYECAYKNMISCWKNLSSHEYPLWFVTLFTKYSLEWSLFFFFFAKKWKWHLTRPFVLHPTHKFLITIKLEVIARSLQKHFSVNEFDKEWFKIKIAAFNLQ